MPTVYRRRRPDGTTAETFTADLWIAGCKYARSTGKRTKREAEKRAVELESEVRAELARQHEPLTIDTALGRYWKEHAERLPSAKSVKYHLARLISILEPAKPLDQLSNADVNDYVVKRRDMMQSRVKEAKRISPATINRELDVLQAAYIMARDSWEHPVRPIDWGRHRMPVDDRPEATLSADEARRAVEWLRARNLDLADALELTFYTGVRFNEMLTLTCGRVNLDKRHMTVLAKRKARQGYRERRVWLSTAAVALLAERIPEGAKAGDLVFRLVNVRKTWEACRKEIGRPEVRWHDLRHSHGTLLGELGDVMVVQRQLGHTNVHTSMRYIHSGARATSEAVEKIPALTERKVVALR